MNALHSQLAAVTAEADALREQVSGSQRQAARELDDRLASELRQQQLKYEQRVQVGARAPAAAAEVRLAAAGVLLAVSSCL